MLEIVSLVVIIFGVLQIILFFKIWGMTNDVSSMQAMMKKALSRSQKGDSNQDAAPVDDRLPLRPGELSMSEFTASIAKTERGYLNEAWSVKASRYAKYRENYRQ